MAGFLSATKQQSRILARRGRGGATQHGGGRGLEVRRSRQTSPAARGAAPGSRRPRCPRPRRPDTSQSTRQIRRLPRPGRGSQQGHGTKRKTASLWSNWRASSQSSWNVTNASTTKSSQRRRATSQSYDRHQAPFTAQPVACFAFTNARPRGRGGPSPRSDSCFFAGCRPEHKHVGRDLRATTQNWAGRPRYRGWLPVVLIRDAFVSMARRAARARGDCWLRQQNAYLVESDNLRDPVYLLSSWPCRSCGRVLRGAHFAGAVDNSPRTTALGRDHARAKRALGLPDTDAYYCCDQDPVAVGQLGHVPGRVDRLHEAGCAPHAVLRSTGSTNRKLHGAGDPCRALTIDRYFGPFAEVPLHRLRHLYPRITGRLDAIVRSVIYCSFSFPRRRTSSR